MHTSDISGEATHRAEVISASLIYKFTKENKLTGEEETEEQRIDAKGQDAITGLLSSFADDFDQDRELILELEKESSDKKMKRGDLTHVILKLERDEGKLLGVVICRYK